MTITEESRDRLYQRLKEAVGEAEATTLMEHLPPVGWADVATKADLDHTREVMNLRFTALEREMDRRFNAVESEMDRRFTAVDSEMERRFGEVNRRFDEQDAKFATMADVANLRTELHKTLRVHTFAIIGAMVAVNGAMTAFLR